MIGGIGCTPIIKDTASGIFVYEDTKEFTLLHIYPAMMIPQVARGLIKLYGKKEMFVDPYCGSGTSLVEGRLAGMMF